MKKLLCLTAAVLILASLGAVALAQDEVITPATLEFVVEGEIIDAPAAFVDDDDCLMVPVRAIAEALGHEVTWEQATKTVMIGNLYSLTIGEDSYNFARMAPISLGSAPVLLEKDGLSVTYVPIRFFSAVMKLNNAYVFEGQIVIDNGEPMR